MAVFAENSNLLSIAGIVLALVALRAVYNVASSPMAKIPGPWYSLWTGWILSFHDLTTGRVSYIHALHEKYGPVVRIGPTEVCVTNIDAVKVVYDTKRVWRKSQYYRDIVAPDSEGMFSTRNLELHERHRKLLMGPLLKSSLHTILPQIHDTTHFAVQRMAEEMKTRGCADVYKWWIFMGTDVIGQLTFGESFRMLELGQNNGYTNELIRFGEMALIRSVFPSIIRLSYKLPFRLPYFGDAIEAGQNMSRYATESLERYRRIVEEKPAALVPPTLFTKMFQADASDELPFNELRAEAESYILAGGDSTGYTLTFLCWEVCRNPPIKDELVRQLQALPSDYTDIHLQNCAYLDHIIVEILRLYSASQIGLPRDVPSGGCELAGYWFDEGVTVAAQTYTMHRNPAVFPRPHEFVPSRWENPTQAMNDSFMSWGRGPSICIGQHLAMCEMRLAAAHFFLTFPNARMSSMEGMSDKDMEPKISVDLTPSGNRLLMELA